MPRTKPKVVRPDVLKERMEMERKMRQIEMTKAINQRYDVMKERAAKLWKQAKRRKQKCMINPYTDKVVALKGKIGLQLKTKTYNPIKRKKYKKKKN